MKVLFLNPPFPQRLTRRYMCTYVSATSLFPPYELLSAAGVARQVAGTEVKLVDCVAENIGNTELNKLVIEYSPDIVLSLIGLESFERDMQCIVSLKMLLPAAVQVVFGHYPSLFAEEILQNTKVDIVIKGEPDETFAVIVQTLIEGKDVTQVEGIVIQTQNGIKSTGIKSRIKHLDKLPMPAFDLMDASLYYEPFMPSPFAMIQTSRGCPFACNYCVTSFGSLFVSKSPEVVINEIITLKKLHHIKSFRIIDDTFTINKKAVIEMCRQLISLDLKVSWTCLSRADTLDRETIKWMKKAGCRRIYFGLESGSQRILDLYKKNINLDKAKQTLIQCREEGIETMGLFMTGLPAETYEDFKATLQFALDSKLTFAGVGELTLYPGTDLYEQLKNETQFSLFPYKNQFIDKVLHSRSIKWRSEFHKQFYLNKSNIFNLSKLLIKNIPSTIKVLKNIVTASEYSTTLYPYLDIEK